MPGDERHRAEEGQQRVGRYELFMQLAKGGMATVHLGRALGAGSFARAVAIKRLHEQYAEDPDFRQMFLNEAQILARIRHPNVVPTLDLIERAGGLFIVMEFIQGVTLKHLQKVLTDRWERIPWPIAASIMEGVLRGLHEAHEARDEHGQPLELVHRDVSPDNVLVDKDGVARVFDFGIAKALGQVQTTRDGQVKGKVPYMTPEQLLGNPVTRRSDIFAASIVLWEALTGKRLFFAEDVGHMMQRVILLEVAPPCTLVPEVPRELEAIVMRGLDRDPSKRFATAGEMADAIAKVRSLATVAEVGKWVQSVAGKQLAALSAMVQQMERTTPLREDAAEATFASKHGRQRRPGGAADDASVSGSASGQTVDSSRPRPDRRRLLFVAAALVAFVGVAALLLLRHGSATTAAASGSASAPAQQTATPGVPTETAGTTAAPTVATASEALASASATSSASAGTAPWAPRTAGTVPKPTTSPKSGLYGID